MIWFFKLMRWHFAIWEWPLVLLLALVGCSSSTPPPPTAPEVEVALEAVWDGVYDARALPRPAVVFQLANCDVYGTPGIQARAGSACLLGWNGQDAVHVLWTGDWATTAFAHELFHRYVIDTTPPWLQSVVAGDPQHKDPRWVTLVPLASAWGTPDLVY
jgi:hypothetical protein